MFDDLRMENAAIIRKCARDLMVRQQIEEFQLLFIDWAASFDPWNYIVNDWGLFNPPGVAPHDEHFKRARRFETALRITSA